MKLKLQIQYITRQSKWLFAYVRRITTLSRISVLFCFRLSFKCFFEQYLWRTGNSLPTTDTFTAKERERVCRRDVNRGVQGVRWVIKIYKKPKRNKVAGCTYYVQPIMCDDCVFHLKNRLSPEKRRKVVNGISVDCKQYEPPRMRVAYVSRQTGIGFFSLSLSFSRFVFRVFNLSLVTDIRTRRRPENADGFNEQSCVRTTAAALCVTFSYKSCALWTKGGWGEMTRLSKTTGGRTKKKQ